MCIIRGGLILLYPLILSSGKLYSFLSSRRYEVMLNCWHVDPKQRPTFAQLTSFCESWNVFFWSYNVLSLLTWSSSWCYDAVKVLLRQYTLAEENFVILWLCHIVFIPVNSGKCQSGRFFRSSEARICNLPSIPVQFGSLFFFFRSY